MVSSAPSYREGLLERRPKRREGGHPSLASPVIYRDRDQARPVRKEWRHAVATKFGDVVLRE